MISLLSWHRSNGFCLLLSEVLKDGNCCFTLEWWFDSLLHHSDIHSRAKQPNFPAAAQGERNISRLADILRDLQEQKLSHLCTMWCILWLPVLPTCKAVLQEQAKSHTTMESWSGSRISAGGNEFLWNHELAPGSSHPDINAKLRDYCCLEHSLPLVPR